MIRVIQEGQKSGGLWGYLLNFPLKNGLPLKIEILQYLDLGLLLEAEILQILLKYVLLAPQYFYMIFFCIFYRPELPNF